MSPRLENIVVNGASRHRMRKGILLIRNDAQAVDPAMRDAIVQRAKRAIAQNAHFQDFTLEISASHPSLVHITTPFLPVYTMDQRDVFIQRLSNVTKIVMQASTESRCYVQAAGVNPVGKDIDEQSLSLCADIHEIEIFDEGEVERIYNLYRQFLAELLAISTNAAIYNGALQKDRSLRMRKNNASFLPHYLSQFSVQNLDQLKRMMRRDHGLSDIRQMDVNPLGGEAEVLLKSDLPLLRKNAASVELRFIDAQCSYAFIRAQIILLQAIAMYGRSLARRGRRLPFMRDDVINENRSL